MQRRLSHRVPRFTCCRRHTPASPYPVIQPEDSPLTQSPPPSVWDSDDDGDGTSDSEHESPDRGFFVDRQLTDVEARYPGVASPAVAAAMLLTTPTVLYDVLYVVVAVAALRYPLLYCFHLFDVIAVSVRLTGVIRAVAHTWRQLLLTFALTLFVVYAYAVVAFVYLRQYYLTPDREFACDTLAACFYYSLQSGLLQGGGVGDATQSPELVQHNAHFVGVLVYDVSFFAVVNVVLLNGVVFSLILNKFTELRERLAAVDTDRANQCFVCDVTRWKLERTRATGLASFDDHVRREHNVCRWC